MNTDAYPQLLVECVHHKTSHSYRAVQVNNVLIRIEISDSYDAMGVRTWRVVESEETLIAAQLFAALASKAKNK